METSSPIFPPRRIYQCTITNLVQLRRQLYPAREKNGNKNGEYWSVVTRYDVAAYQRARYILVIIVVRLLHPRMHAPF